MKETAGCLTWLITLALLVIVEPVLHYFFWLANWRDFAVANR